MPALREAIPPGKTLLVLPEGIMLNYLLRLESPNGPVNYLPVETAVFGEPRILSGLQKTPPDFVIVVRKDLSEFGFRALDARRKVDVIQDELRRQIAAFLAESDTLSPGPAATRVE